MARSSAIRSKTQVTAETTAWIQDNFNLWKGSFSNVRLMGPVVFKVFANDLLLQMSRNSDSNIYNYADDKTVSVCDKTIHSLNKLTEIMKCQDYCYVGLLKITCRQMLLNFNIL